MGLRNLFLSEGFTSIRLMYMLLSDKRRDGGEFSLFECYSLLVLIDKAFGENVFLLIKLMVDVGC